METMLHPFRWEQALYAVERNGGAPGPDGMRVAQLRKHLGEHGGTIRRRLLEGRYKPGPVRRVNIPKPGGGERALGIPNVQDRFIQQLVQLALTPGFEPHFSKNSHGFRLGRSAHGAVAQAKKHAQEGCDWVVRNDEGAPQGGPLSPLLTNIYLDALDKELEKRGCAFSRYADDCNIYVASERAAQDALEKLTAWIRKHLRLEVNAGKSGTGRPWTRKFPGFILTTASPALGNLIIITQPQRGRLITLP